MPTARFRATLNRVSCEDLCVSVAVIDAEALSGLQRLVDGPLEKIEALVDAEWILRVVLLHDELQPIFLPASDCRGPEWLDLVAALDPEAASIPIVAKDPSETRTPLRYSGGLNPALTAMELWLSTFHDVSQKLARIPSDFKVSQTLYDAVEELTKEAENHSPARRPEQEQTVLRSALLESARDVAWLVCEEGSVALASPLGSVFLPLTQKLPLSFEHLDRNWHLFAHQCQSNGLDLLVPPLLSVVLTRCSRRDAIPSVIRDLRNEWATPRQKVWSLLAHLRTSRTLGEAEEIQKELADASKLLCPDRSEIDVRPMRVLWEIIAAGAAGAGVAAVSGGHPALGAVTGGITQAARNLPAFTHEFGEILFGRGAFDLARRVRRAVSTTELDALPRLLSKAERDKLGFR